MMAFFLSANRFVRSIAGGHFFGKTASTIVDSFSIKDLLPILFNTRNSCGGLLGRSKKQIIAALPAGGQGCKCGLESVIFIQYLQELFRKCKFSRLVHNRLGASLFYFNRFKNIRPDDWLQFADLIKMGELDHPCYL